MKLLVAWLALVVCPLALGQDKVIVSGASGQLGSLVIDELLARNVAPESLILVSRTPDTDHLKMYAARGASVRFGDFNQPESLDTAYRGGTRMLLISINGGGGNRPDLHKVAIDAAMRAGVKQIAYTSYVNVQMVRDGRFVTHTPDARVAYVTREDCAAAAAAVLATPGHDNKAYNITGPDAIGAGELVALASEISGKQVELVVRSEADYRPDLADSGMPAAAINGTISFAAELDSPYLREPSTAAQ
jgi:NAD(P)H dehydrogenase (quinone)